MRLRVLVVIALTSCLQAGNVRCPDDSICPATYTCAPNGCYSPDEVRVCVGLLEDAPCGTDDGNGVCKSGGCATYVCGNGLLEPGEVCDDGDTLGGDGCNARCTSNEQCGNGLVDPGEECDESGVLTATCTVACKFIQCPNGVTDPGEVCDDGNVIPGDGCSYNCQSNETCGNGFIDFVAGEQCDDTNTFAFDGCGACRSEARIWRDLPLRATPTAREFSAMAYDAGRRRIVMFGGRAAADVAETWERDGRTWELRSPLRSPPRRSGASMVYDHRRGRILLFGGRRGGQLLADLWSYDGLTWTEITPPTAPPARERAAMAYDPRRDRVVLFGGSTNGMPPPEFGDTWEYDGSTWSFVTGASTPAPRYAAAMAFDPRHGAIVLYGGVDDVGPFRDVWELGATGWTQLADAPRGRYDHQLVFDVARQRLVAVGGTVANNPTCDLDEFDGASWTLRVVTGAVPTCARAGVAYDAARSRIVAFSGSQNSVLVVGTNEIGATGIWELPSLAQVPPSTIRPMLVEDPIRQRLVMFGGELLDFGDVSNATRELVGDDWTLVSDPPDNATTAPSPRRNAAIAYDRARRRIVLFGGRGAGAGGPLGDTWSYDGTAWTLIAPHTCMTCPAPRFDAAMAYDLARDRIVLFGGATGSASNETWELDGATWTQVTPLASPTARSGHGLVYDRARSRIVMYGPPVDFLVWEYDGTTWRGVATPQNPPLGTSNIITMTYDDERGVTLLFDGVDAWTYDGVDWAVRVPDDDVPPEPRGSTSVAYSIARRALVVVGGAGPFTSYELGYRATVAPELCTIPVDLDGDGLSACADPECWPACAPACPPGATGCLPSGCGDGSCDPGESCLACPGDCACDTCGDLGCGPGEATTCPGDC